MIQCDLCCKEAVELTSLQSYYQTSEVKQVCGGCEFIINQHLTKIKAIQQDATCGLFKRYLNILRRKVGVV